MGDRDVVGHVIEAAAGPLTWDHADFARGTVDGRPISFEMRYSKSAAALHLRGVDVETVDGRLRMPRTILRHGGEQIAGPEEIAVVCANIQSIGARLVEASDAAYEEVRRTEGDAAATAWHDANAARWGEHRSRSRVRRLAFLAGFLACAVGVAYAMTVGWF